MSLAIRIPYNPRKVFLPFHASPKRFKIVVAHRRCGKTVAAINELVKEVLSCIRPNPRGAYVAPTYSQAKDVAWTYLKEYTRSIPGIKFYETELRVDFPTGARIKLYGAENEDRLRGLYFDVVVIDEFASMSPKIWEEVIRPSLSDRNGKAIFLGTPKGIDAFHELWTHALEDDTWFHLMLRASETGILTPEELAANLKLMDESTYSREFECDFAAAFEGAFFAKEVSRAYSENRIRQVLHDISADTFCSWDLGISDKMSLWVFQVINREWHWLQTYENTSQDLGHYIDWTKSLKYKINTHFLPHDAAARELSTGKSRQEFMSARGLNTEVVKRTPVEDQINAARVILPRSYFDEKGCIPGLTSLRMFQSSYSEKNRVLSQKPLHNWASHSASAFMTGVLGVDESFLWQSEKSDWKKPIARNAKGTYA